tara:strand:+ start:832 stop:1026 length:195 start_codon:yes stop_codon:yes gene_type:complete
MQLPFMGTVAVDDFNHGTRAAVAGGTTFLSTLFLFIFLTVVFGVRFIGAAEYCWSFAQFYLSIY